MATNERIPAEVFPPGEFIRDALESRELTQADLADILGRSVAVVNEIITGKTSITPETAHQLAAVFDTSPEVWLRAEAAYRASIAPRPSESIQRRARIFEFAPIKEMQKRSWLQKTKSVDELESDLLGFFHIENFDSPPPVEMAAKSSAGPGKEVTRAQIAWCYKCMNLASSLQVGTFSVRSAKAIIPELRKLAASPEGVRLVPRFLADAGIRFVVVERMNKTLMDGAALWLQGDKRDPVLALSCRTDTIGNFWHTLLHELSHIIHGDGFRLDENLFNPEHRMGEKDEAENRANEDAANILIPKADLESFILRVKPFYRKDRIIRFANKHKIHPGIVVGQLHHRQEIHWRTNKETLAKIRDIITPVALSDGWGCAIG